jgi:hypothetical protein
VCTDELLNKNILARLTGNLFANSKDISPFLSYEMGIAKVTMTELKK